MRSKLLKTATILLAICLAIGMAGFTTGCGHKDEASVEQATSQAAEQADEQKADEPLATVLMASDYQDETGWPAPGENLRNIFRGATEDGKNIDQVIICGDYTNDRVLHDYQMSPEDSIAEIRQILQEETGGDGEALADSALFLQGNHDRLTESIAKSGLHEYDNFLVYVLNTESDYPWKQGKTAGCLKKVKNTAAEMDACLDKLIKAGETRPIIIAEHVPLHFTGRTSTLHTTGDNLYASLIFDVVNRAAKSLDITVVYGHNHSKGWDCYMGESCVFRAPGDSILIPEFSEKDVYSNTFVEKKLNFTYMNAGYLGYCMNCSPNEIAAGTVDQYDAAETVLTATVCEIYKDKIVFTRYSSEGAYRLGGEGCANPYRNDSSLIPAQYYSVAIDSPQIIKRKAIN